MRRTIQSILIAGTSGLWIALAWLIVRQRHLLETGNPTSDTGISFGNAYLTDYAVPGLLAISAIVIGVLAWMKRSTSQRPPRNP